MESVVKKKSKELYKAELKETRRKTAKPLLYLGIVSIVMLFAAFTSAYIIRANHGEWKVFNLPDIGILSTAVIVTSSLTLIMAQQAIKKNNQRLTTIGLAITLVLGITFFITQYIGWKQLTSQGIYFMGKSASASGSFLYLIALVHLAHMIGGIIALCVSLTKSLLKKYSAADFLGIELTAIYWHFLGLLWVYLFLFLYFYR